MAKAKKTKSARSKKPATKNSGSNGPALFLIVAILGLLVLYAIRQNPDWSEQVRQLTSEKINPETASKEASDKQSEASKPKETQKPVNKTQPTSKKEAPVVEQKKFEEDKIDAQNGVVETVKSNENLPVYSEDDNYYYASSFDFTWPAYTQNDAIVEHGYYTLCYNEKLEQPTWVAYRLSGLKLSQSKYNRTDDFRQDPDVKTKSATPDDYKGSGYDRGHLAPAADFAWTEQGMSESFFMSNMSPQNPGFNRGIWKKLEEKVRDWARSNTEIFVVTGPICTSKSEKIGKNKVVVPDQYYKVILELNGKEVKGIGFLLKNEKTSKDLSAFATSIDEVEKATGLDFFPAIPDALENKIESTYSYMLWK